MTAHDWTTCREPDRMLAHLRGRVSDRKLLLFAVACCRRVEARIPAEYRPLVAKLEPWAEADRRPSVGSFLADVVRGLTGDPFGLADILLSVNSLGVSRFDVALFAGRYARALETYPEGQRPGVYEMVFGQPPEEIGEHPAQCDLLREIAGDPFRPVEFRDEWRTPTVRDLAAAVYQQPAWDRCPILADALEEAGCDRGDLLAHLRDGSSHVRGCWAVDLALGRG